MGDQHFAKNALSLTVFEILLFWISNILGLVVFGNVEICERFTI